MVVVVAAAVAWWDKARLYNMISRLYDVSLGSTRETRASFQWGLTPGSVP